MYRRIALREREGRMGIQGRDQNGGESGVSLRPKSTPTSLDIKNLKKAVESNDSLVKVGGEDAPCARARA